MQARARMTGLFMLVTMASLVVPGCSSRTGDDVKLPDAPPLPAVASVKLTDQLSLGKAIVAENVTVWPVYSNAPVPEGQGEFITLADAQEKKLAEVREKGAPAQSAGQAQVVPQAPNPPPQQQANAQQHDNNAVQQVVQNIDSNSGDVGGQVNELVIENKGTQPILVLAGTLVKGGKQDRQIAQDFIIPPGKTVPVGAFCVEQGRWTASREGQTTMGYFQAQKVLAPQAVRDNAQFKGNQGDVWSAVADTNAGNAKSPQTGTLFATIDETDKEALARRERLQKAIAEGLTKSSTTPVGIAYAIDGKVREIRAFNDPRILKHYQELILSTIAIEADTAQRKALKDGKQVFAGTVDAKDVTAVIAEAEKNRKENVQTPAGNFLELSKGETSSVSKNYAAEDDKNEGKAPVSQTWSNH